MNAIAEHYWSGCADHEIRYQRCAGCGTTQNYPRPFCHVCGAPEPAWHKAGHEGVVAAATTVYRAPTDVFAEIAPYRLLLVEKPEGFRLMAHGEPHLKVGDAVTIGFRSLGSKTLPYCKGA